MTRREHRHRNIEEREAASWRAALIVILIIVLLGLVAATSQAGELADLDPFLAVSRLDGAQQLTLLMVLAAVDYKQTVDNIVADPERFREMNPLLGPHPSRQELLAFGLAGVAAVALLRERLPPAVADIVIPSIVATEQLNVMENRYMERRSGFPIMLAANWRF